jgi:hypothetical protein
MKRWPKFASIVDRVLTLPSNVPIDANNRFQLRGNATIMETEVTLVLPAPIHVHLFYHQQRHHPFTKEVLRQLKQPRHVSIMDNLVILPSDNSTYVNYRPQPKATRMWHELWPTRSATTVDRRVTLLLRAPIHVHTLL